MVDMNMLKQHLSQSCVNKVDERRENGRGRKERKEKFSKILSTTLRVLYNAINLLYSILARFK
jgi:predicted metal-dependent hydrolase